MESWAGPGNEATVVSSLVRQPQQLHEQHALLYLCPGLTQSMFFLLCCFSSAACSVKFDSMFPFLNCYLWGPLQVNLKTQCCHIKDPQSFTSRTRWFHINYTLDLCWAHGCKTAEEYTCTFKFFHNATIANTNVFTVQHTNTYIRTYIRTLLPFNTLMRGLLRLAPISEWVVFGFLWTVISS